MLLDLPFDLSHTPAGVAQVKADVMDLLMGKGFIKILPSDPKLVKIASMVKKRRLLWPYYP
jgi:hypothetical protein